VSPAGILVSVWPTALPSLITMLLEYWPCAVPKYTLNPAISDNDIGALSSRSAGATQDRLISAIALFLLVLVSVAGSVLRSELIFSVAAVGLFPVLHADICRVINKVIRIDVKRCFSKREIIIGAL